MNILSLISLIFIIILIAIQLKKRDFLERNIKKIFWIPIASVFLLSTVFSIIQYRVWREDDLMRFTFEADGGLYAFFHNVFFNYFAPHILSFVLVGLLALLMLKLNQRSGERFFEKEEIFIAFLAGFLVSFPGFLFFILGLLIFYLAVHLIHIIIRRNEKPIVIPLYFFWLPVSAFVIIISEIWLSRLAFWGLLSV